MVVLMSHRRRRVFVDTPKGFRDAGFTVPETADAADVSMRLRERGWAPYRVRLDSEQHARRHRLAARRLIFSLLLPRPWLRRLAETNCPLSTG
jgi:hypothetical protein